MIGYKTVLQYFDKKYEKPQKRQFYRIFNSPSEAFFRFSSKIFRKWYLCAK